MSQSKSCALTECDRPRYSKDYCRPHYRKLKLYGDPHGTGYATEATDKARFFRFVDKTDTCWNWTGNKHRGYGQFTIGWKPRRLVRAHRQAYEWAKGSIPEGLTLDHLCSNRGCVNPDHLEPVTNRENNLRSPNTLTGKNIRKTHCPSGHPYSGDNLILWKGEYRICRACNYASTRKRRARLKALREQNG